MSEYDKGRALRPDEGQDIPTSKEDVRETIKEAERGLDNVEVHIRTKNK